MSVARSGVHDLPGALAALADLGIHPIGVTVDRSLVAIRLPRDEQRTLMGDVARRDRVVEIFQAYGFLYVTLTLDQHEESAP